MDRSQPESSTGGGDRLSKLDDRVLGNILSFLPANEAASAALLSSRWRHVFGAVHTVSLEEPEPPIPDDDRLGCYSPTYPAPRDPNPPPPFRSIVSAALIARQCHHHLRALRVATRTYRGADASEVDQWVSYALRQAAQGGVDLALRFWCHRLLCQRPYALCPGNNQRHRRPDQISRRRPITYKIVDPPPRKQQKRSDDDSSVVSSDDESPDDLYRPPPRWVQPQYTVPRVLFSCAELRSLSLGSCRLAPPATVRLPSLVTLLLSHVPDSGADVERIFAGCPRLADLTLEACGAVTALTVLDGGARLRRLALRCCHKLATVAVHASELRAFEYRGAVPGASFLIMHGVCGRVTDCKVDICGAEATSEEELINLRRLLRLFVNAKHLHLESARLGSGFDKDVPMRLARFSSLRRLEMRGRLPENDTGAIDAMSRILELTPNLEALSLAFHPQEHDPGLRSEIPRPSEEDLLDAHHLSYSRHSVLAAPSAMIPCLRSRVREINLVHYQGGTAQRALAKFLLCNAPAIGKLWCEFAEGPMFEQIQLMREIKGWLINKSADTHFA